MIALTPTDMIFCGQMVNIQIETANGETRYTVTSHDNSDPYMQALQNRIQEWCSMIERRYRRATAPSRDDCQITCRVPGEALPPDAVTQLESLLARPDKASAVAGSVV